MSVIFRKHRAHTLFLIRITVESDSREKLNKTRLKHTALTSTSRTTTDGYYRHMSYQKIDRHTNTLAIAKTRALCI